MRRVVHKSTSHDEARAWDIKQQREMTPQQRMQAARILRDRYNGTETKDIRAWHRSE